MKIMIVYRELSPGACLLYNQEVLPYSHCDFFRQTYTVCPRSLVNGNHLYIHMLYVQEVDAHFIW